MGMFSQRPSAYTPPLDGSKADPTLVGGGTTASAPAESEEQYAAQLGTDSLPKPEPWRIELQHHDLLEDHPGRPRGYDQRWPVVMGPMHLERQGHMGPHPVVPTGAERSEA
jgi:hypothetical protein